MLRHMHSLHSGYLSEDLERLQKGAMKIIYPELSYAQALELSGRLTLACLHGLI